MSIYVSAEVRWRIREQFNDRCAYCQTAEWLTVAIFEMEHITPLSLGGETAIENLCLACPTCNRYKSDRTLVPSGTGGETRLFHPQQDKWPDHFRWNGDSSELIALTEIGQSTIDLLRMNRPQIIRVRQMWVAMDEHPPY